MKHRVSKIKYQHKMIQGLERFLKNEILPLGYVSSIFPGEIKRTKTDSSQFKVRFQYATSTGAKLLVHGSGVVQEIFVVTNNAEALRNKLAKE